MSQVEVVEKAHSKLGASSYHQWRECPACVKFCENLPNKSSVYAEEGTLAHDLASQVLLKTFNTHWPPKFPDMAAAVNVYIEHIDTLRAQKPDFEAVEQKFNLSKYHKDLFGTADYVCYYAETKTLHVVDYKHGAGVAVEVFDKETGEGNDQLMYYGLGALHENQFPISKIVLTVVQPRCYHVDGPVRSWSCTPLVMLDYAADLIDNALKTEDPKAIFKTGDHCRWCRGQATCPEASKTANAVATAVFDPVLSYDPQKLSDTLSKLDQVEAWCKSVRSFAYSEAEAGRVPPGFKLVDKRANRKWIEAVVLKPELITEKMPKLTLDKITATNIVGITMVEKYLDYTEKKVLAQFTGKEASGKKLVPVNDDRPKVESKVQSVFDKIEN